jgi:hypothetical protein
MIVTKNYIEKAFRKYNALYFNNELNTPIFKLSSATRCMGMFICDKIGNMTIKITKAFDITEKELDNTIIHEMIHQYIFEKKIKDTSGHGIYWHKIARSINKDGWNITQFGECPQTLAPTTREKGYCMFSMLDKSGDRFVFRVTPTLVTRYSKALVLMGFRDIHYTTSFNAEFDAFTNCRRKIKGRYISHNEWEKMKVKERFSHIA